MVDKIDRSALVVQNRGTLLDHYDVETKALGTGTYGSVVKAVNNSTKVIRACKAMARKNIKNEVRFREEIALMKQIDHPNIIRLFETIEDHKNIYLIMELCTGGELFDKIVNEGLLAEKPAAHLMKQIFAALYYLHDHGIMHRDLKPENFLFASHDADAPVKVIDFGLGATFTPGQRMSTKAGTPYYVSPQVLKGNYNEKCDIWSAGVIMFILMAGYPPFYGDKDAEILAKVRKAQFDFPSEEEDGITFSGDAQDLISQCLIMEEDQRPSAAVCLRHKWLSQDARDEKVNPSVIKNFKNFHATQRFKKLALTAIATQLNEKEIKTLKETFLALDKNGDGTLSLEEIKIGCKKNNIARPQNFDSVFSSIDSDNSGVIDYTEFIAATMENSFQYREDLCWSAFRVFDIDGDGKITVQELQKALKSSDMSMSEEKIADIIAEFDKNKDGCIDFDEFCAMMRDGAVQT